MASWYRITKNMEYSRKHRWVTLGSIVVAIVGVCSAAYLCIVMTKLSDPFTREHTITLTGEGFEPAVLAIRAGDTVIFETDHDQPFWPASSFHPTHSLYEEFDPQKPVLPSGEWSFTFDLEGVWTYHDHLDPQKTGEIRVLSIGDILPRKTVPCEQLEGSVQMRCFDQELKQKLEEGGIEAAFDYFRQLYRDHPEVAYECHDWMHTLGEREYQLYAEGDEVRLKEEASLCGYGYYHGFIGALVAQTQSLQEAERFCTEAVSAHEAAALGVEESCLHGIGHSVATLALEGQERWGDVLHVIESASSECLRLYPDTVSDCLDGMFHELYTSVGRGDYGLTAEEYIQGDDPFMYCHELEDVVAVSCFSEFMKLWPYFFGEDKVAMMRYVLSAIPGILSDSPRVLHSLVRSFIEMDIATGEYTQSVAACGIVPQALKTECMRGFAIGFATHGEPGNMHEQGFAFCRDVYAGEERATCLKVMVRELIARYPDERMRAACQQLSTEEQRACADI